MNVKIKAQSKWLFDDSTVKQGLLILQRLYYAKGYELSLMECYDVWTLYSGLLSANWISIDKDTDVTQSIDMVIENPDCWA